MNLDLNELNLKSLVQPLPSRSTPDLIAEALRQAIGHGLFGEGQSLRQDEIAGQFGVSRIPVREALRQLEVEGLVTFHPNRGAMVAVLSVSEAQEICEIRVVLETMALELAIPQLSDLDLGRASELLQTIQRAVTPEQWADLNWQFYMALYTPANRARLLSLINMLHVNIDRYMRLQRAESTTKSKALADYQELLDACWRRDSKSATQILRQHLEQTAATLLSYLEQRSQSGHAVGQETIAIAKAVRT